MLSLAITISRSAPLRCAFERSNLFRAAEPRRRFLFFGARPPSLRLCRAGRQRLRRRRRRRRPELIKLRRRRAGSGRVVAAAALEELRFSRFGACAEAAQRNRVISRRLSLPLPGPAPADPQVRLPPPPCRKLHDKAHLSCKAALARAKQTNNRSAAFVYVSTDTVSTATEAPAESSERFLTRLCSVLLPDCILCSARERFLPPALTSGTILISSALK